MTARPLLELRGLCRDYRLAGGGLRRAVDEVSLAIEPGVIFGLVGESGSGKSTLARIAMALDRPTAGEVLFEGESLFALKRADLARRRRGFQMVFQDPYGSLDPRQTVGRIVAEPLHLDPDAPPRRRDRLALVERMLGEVGLEADAARRHPHAFSGGQRQRIAIARALICRPRLLVADEAVSALDVTVQAQVLALLTTLRDRHGLAMLFITHNLAVVDEIADRVGVMQGGRLVETGPVREVLDRPAHPYTQRLLAAEPTLAGLGQPRGRPAPRPVTA